MKREFYQQHSDILNQDMSMIVYGEGGYPVIVFQTQDSKSNNFEDFGMIDELADFIESGQIQIFSVDNIDEQSWSAKDADKAARAERQEEYFRFVTDELVPRVHSWNNSTLRPLAMGCSMGATHAALAALRRPDLFQGCIALSGVYRTSFFFGDWMNSTLYDNDICAFLSNMPADHPYVKLYNERQLIFCVGQGAWEDGIDDLRQIDAQFQRLGVNAWCDFWGPDVNHDWPWWKKQARYFLPKALEWIHEGLEAEQPAAAKTPAKTVTPVAKPAAKTSVQEAKPAAKATTATDTKPVSKPAKKQKEFAAEKQTSKPAAKPATKKPAAAKTSATAKKSEAPAKPVATATKATSVKKPVAKKETASAKAAKKDAEAKTQTKAATKSAVPASKAPATKSASKAEKPATKVKPADAKAAATKTADTKAAHASKPAGAASKPATKTAAKAAASSASKAVTASKPTAKPATAKPTVAKKPAKAAAKAKKPAAKRISSTKRHSK